MVARLTISRILVGGFERRADVENGSRERTIAREEDEKSTARLLVAGWVSSGLWIGERDQGWKARWWKQLRPRRAKDWIGLGRNHATDRVPRCPGGLWFVDFWIAGKSRSDPTTHSAPFSTSTRNKSGSPQVRTQVPKCRQHTPNRFTAAT